MDFPLRPGLLDFIRQLDDIVLEFGGRVYLAKDCCLSAQSFRKMYPQWKDWQSVCSELDPEHRFQSSLSTRLELAQ
jgi:FAD/FMN-containing dehydrogenase